MSQLLAGVVERLPGEAAFSRRRDAFDDIVVRYTSRVTRAAYRITENFDDARDVAQFVFMQMYVKSPDFDDHRAIDRWLYVVTRNAALRLCSRRRDDAFVLGYGDEPPPGLEDIVLRNERDQQVRATIATLPQADRRLIELRHLLSMPTTEIALELRIPIKRVKREVERAKLRLRVEMRRRGLDGDAF